MTGSILPFILNLHMKKKYFLLILISILMFILLRIPYRNFIYLNEIFDFYIADTSPNFMAIFLYVFFYKWKYRDQFSTLYLISVSFGASIFYEVVIQQILTLQTFDKLDIVASFFGSVLCFFICLKIENKNIKEELKFKFIE